MSLYNKLPSTQLKDLTSSDLMKLGQLTFIDNPSKQTLNQLTQIKSHVLNLVSPGSTVFADSLKMSAQTINGGSGNYKPSTIYDGESYASTYLVQVLGISATCSGGDSGLVSVGVTDGASSLFLVKPATVTASAPLIFEPTSPLYLNESNYLNITNSASVDAVCTVYCAIVARGGAQ